LTLEQVVSWAASEGFETLEIACWPAAGGERRRYAGITHIDVDSFGPDAVHELLGAHGLEISALAYYPNNLHPDAAHREEVNAHLRKVVDAARRSALASSAPSPAMTRRSRRPTTCAHSGTSVCRSPPLPRSAA
jgi:sugar phosphate isomerase/epimerase